MKNNFDEMKRIAQTDPDVIGAMRAIGIDLRLVSSGGGKERYQTTTTAGRAGDLSSIVVLCENGKWTVFDNKQRFGRVAMDSIEAIRQFGGLDFKEAVRLLAGNRAMIETSSRSRHTPAVKTAAVDPATEQAPEESKPFEIPQPVNDKLNRVAAYLTKSRYIPPQLVATLISKKLTYATPLPPKKGEPPKENPMTLCAFPSFNEQGEIVGAETCTTLSGYKFKHIVSKSNPDYAWFFPFNVDLDKVTPDTFLFFCESAIDAMSLCALSGLPGIYISMAGLKDRTLVAMAERLGGTPMICVDRDEAGDRFAARFPQYERMKVPDGTGKDWNDCLKHYELAGQPYALKTDPQRIRIGEIRKAEPEPVSAPAPTPDISPEKEASDKPEPPGETVPSQEAGTKEKNPPLLDGGALNGKITIYSSEHERFLLLKSRVISLSARVNDEKMAHISGNLETSPAEVETLNMSDRRRLIRKIGEEFNIFKAYENADIQLVFEYSKRNLRESLNKQKGQYGKFIRMLSCFDEVIQNAVGIEMHNRNAIQYKVDDTLKQCYVLSSAFQDHESIVPVKLEIKEFLDKPNALYVAVALEGIKQDEVVAQEVVNHDVAQQVARSSTISIADFFRLVNPSETNFTKYIPREFLTPEQITLLAQTPHDDPQARDLLLDEAPSATPAARSELRSDLPTWQVPTDPDQIKEALGERVKAAVAWYRSDPKALADLLAFSARFHGRYSFHNQRLIWSQNPNAHFVASAGYFKAGMPNENGQKVTKSPILIRKGEKALRIWKPYEDSIVYVPGKDGHERPTPLRYLSKETKKQAKAEGWRTETDISYTLVPVFDITQTTAPPEIYPSAFGFGGNENRNAEEMCRAVSSYAANELHCPVTVADLREQKATTRGWFDSTENSITLSDMLSGDGKLSTLLHEVGHAELHRELEGRLGKTTAQKEFEADMYSMMLEIRLGIEPTEARCLHLGKHHQEYLKEVTGQLPEGETLSLNAEKEAMDNVLRRYYAQAPILDEYLGRQRSIDRQLMAAGIGQDQAVATVQATRSEIDPKKAYRTPDEILNEGVRQGKKSWSTPPPFEQQLQDWLHGCGQRNGTYNGRYFDLGRTPDVYIKHGANDTNMIMFTDCLIKVTGGKHSIALDELAHLPQELQDPILLFKGSQPNSFVALTDMLMKNGNHAVVAIHINRHADRQYINKIASIHSRTTDTGYDVTNSYVLRNIEQGNLIHASTQKAPTWFTSRGLQLPTLVQTMIGTDNSIPHSPPAVNPSESKKCADPPKGTQVGR